MDIFGIQDAYSTRLRNGIGKFNNWIDEGIENIEAKETNNIFQKFLYGTGTIGGEILRFGGNTAGGIGMIAGDPTKILADASVGVEKIVTDPATQKAIGQAIVSKGDQCNNNYIRVTQCTTQVAGVLADIFLGRKGIGLLNKADEVSDTGRIWSVAPTQRGNMIEDALSLSDYKGYYRIGQESGGKFPLVDFQSGNKLVSLKTLDRNVNSGLGDIISHMEDLGRGALVDGKPAQMILDVRVPIGSDIQAIKNILTPVANSNNVELIIKTY